MQPRFVAPLTGRGRKLVQNNREQEVALVTSGGLPDIGTTLVAREALFEMVSPTSRAGYHLFRRFKQRWREATMLRDPMRPNISRSAMRRLFFAAFDDFCAAEGANIRNGTSERNLCQRLAFPLERNAFDADLQHYRADCEYNRSNDGRVKTIVGQDMEVVTITCDLILHSRGEDAEQDNLIAIEMKRASHPQSEKDKDRVRLMALTRAPGNGVWSADGQVNPNRVCD